MASSIRQPVPIGDAGPLPAPHALIGVDFSGGQLAGEKIWVARARTQGTGLQLEELRPALDLPHSGASREVAFPALVNWLAEQAPAFCGCDFPFSLGVTDLANLSWPTWLETTIGPIAKADDLRAKFPEAKRPCDLAAKTPFAPLNLRLYRQTYHGLHDVLWPLVRDHDARGLPFQDPSGTLNLLEVCPASLLKAEKLYLSYKGKSATQLANRNQIWNQLCSPRLTCPDATRERALQDTEGDALDAVLAVLCVERALLRPETLRPSAQAASEGGRVYF